jgi:hypothetical protein
MACGFYLVAQVEIEAFWRPIGQRSPDDVAALAARPAHFTKEMLRSGLDHVLQGDAGGRPMSTPTRSVAISDWDPITGRAIAMPAWRGSSSTPAGQNRESSCAGSDDPCAAASRTWPYREHSA